MSLKLAAAGVGSCTSLFSLGPKYYSKLLLSSQRHHHHTYTHIPFSRRQSLLLNRVVYNRPIPHGYLSGSMRTITHYERLGITPPSNEKEIKLAYFKRAKECHPDLHGNNKKLEFQELSQSYQVLSDPTKKAEYDQFGNQDDETTRYSGKTGGGMSPPMEEKEAFKVFHDVFRDLGVVQYLEDLEFDVKLAYDRARTTKDYQPFWNLMKERKGLVLGLLIPSVAIFRSPWLAMAFFRGAKIFGMTILQLLMKNEQTQYLVLTYIWRQMLRAYKKVSPPPPPPYGKGGDGNNRSRTSRK